MDTKPNSSCEGSPIVVYMPMTQSNNAEKGNNGWTADGVLRYREMRTFTTHQASISKRYRKNMCRKDWMEVEPTQSDKGKKLNLPFSSASSWSCVYYDIRVIIGFPLKGFVFYLSIHFITISARTIAERCCACATWMSCTASANGVQHIPYKSTFNRINATTTIGNNAGNLAMSPSQPGREGSRRDKEKWMQNKKEEGLALFHLIKGHFDAIPTLSHAMLVCVVGACASRGNLLRSVMIM